MPVTSIPILTLPGVAQSAITQGRAVQVVSSGSGGTVVAQATVAGQKVIGVAVRAAATGADIDVVAIGVAACEAGAAIAAGARVACDSSGRVVTAAALAVAAGATPVTSAAANGAAALTGGDPPAYTFGIALGAASAAGDFIEVLLR